MAVLPYLLPSTISKLQQVLFESLFLHVTPLLVKSLIRYFLGQICKFVIDDQASSPLLLISLELSAWWLLKQISAWQQEVVEMRHVALLTVEVNSIHGVQRYESLFREDGLIINTH